MNLLCLDTSTKNLSLAVSRDEKILRYRNLRLERPLDKSMMPGIKGVLQDAGMTVKELDGFAVGLGPGSFTSLRVGLSTVKGLAFALKKPAIGISSLDILAMNVVQDTQVCSLCDARRNLVYTCLYKKEGPILIRRSDYLLTDIKDVLKRIQGEVTFVGDGLKIYQDVIQKDKTITPAFADEKAFSPQARHLLPLVLNRAKAGRWDDIDKMVPLYLYPDHCQIKKMRSKA
jgi:tRNA threonylcarbamoyladenosine biosynthesis protein TsaB